MAISSKKLVYDFDRKHHSIISGKNKKLALVDIIAYLNEGQEIWYENRVFVAQKNQKVRNDLRVFKVDKFPLKCEVLDEGSCLAKYPTNLYHRLNQLAFVTADCCPGINKEIIPRILQSDDLHEARHNPFRGSDFYFEQLNSVEHSDGLVLYHDQKMNVDSVLIDYYRKPNPIHAPTHELCGDQSYYLYDGSIINEDSDFENDNTYSANMVVDIAILLASRDVSDTTGFQTQLAKIFQTQNIGKGD